MLLRRVGAVEQRLLHTDIKGGWLSLLKADSWQRGDELQCHMQKTRIKALSCMAYTYPFPPELSSRILGCEDTCVAGKPQLRAESRPQHQERQSRVRREHRRLPPLPGCGWGKHTAPHGDQTHCSRFGLYLTHQPPKGC